MAKKYSNNPIPDKYTDWGKDPTYFNYPFSGQSVQDYIKKQFDNKVGYLHPDASNENYLLFADADNYNLYMQDPVQYANLLIGTVPLVSNYTVSIELENTEIVNYINYGDTGNYIQAYFKVLNKAGVEISDEFKVTITIRNGSAIRTLYRNATYGTLFSLNVDEYLTEGTNVVTLSVAAVTYNVGSSMSLMYHAIVLRVSDNLDLSEVYGSENEVIEAAVHIEGTGTKRIEWYIDGVQLPFDSQTDETSQSSTTLTRYISVSQLAEGRHNLQYRATVNINSVNFYSDTQYRDFIVYRGETLNTIIVNSFSYRGASLIDPTDDPIDLGSVEQYMTKEIKYAIYNPNNVAVNALEITIGSKTITVNADNYNEYVYELKAFNAGSTNLSFSLNGTTLEYDVDVEQSSLDLATIGNTEFEFEGNCRVNTSIDKRLENWSFRALSGNTYSASMSGFDYTERNGWTGEGLIIGAGASLAFNCAPLNYNIVQNGGTFEFEFETRRVLDDDEVICTLMQNGVGIRITASEAKIVSQQGVELSCKYKAEERNRITFVINPLNAAVNKGLVFIFINGILSGVKNYQVGDSFTSNIYAVFTGSSDANIVLYQLRFYRRALRLDEVLNNYILYRPSVDELLEAYDKNDIYTSGSLSLDKLSAQTPIIIITGNVQELQDFTKADKGTYRKMAKIEVINTDDPTKNLTLVDASMRCQGTSSMNYPKKNFRFYTQADSKDETVQSYTTKMYDYEGTEYTGEDRLYAFKAGAQPVKTWCLKADYAESSSTHNTGTARLWNNLLKNAVIQNVDQRYYRNTTTPCRTQAQQAAIDNNYEYDVRTAIDGFPIVLFYHLNENDPLIFLGKYNWNNDKSTESVFGFTDIPGFNDEHMECWEVVNGDYPENLFTDLTNWDTDIQYEGKTMKGWQRAFEARYPDDSGKPSEQTRADQALKTFAVWINGLKTAAKVQGGQVVVDDPAVMATFTAEKWLHMDVYKMAAYYVYLMRQGAVDQTVKNAMFTTEDGQHWYYILYDNDTINGLDNNGALAFGYDIDRQTIDPRTGNSYCYAGHDSVLWNNLEADADFMAIVKIVDQALYNVGLTYASAINMYNNEQSKKWSERIHNLDSQYKYLDPFLNDNNSVGLPKLQGSRDTHRQWWLSNRFALYDAINVTGAYKANVFLVRVASVTLPAPVNAYITPARTGQVYGYGKGGVPIVAGVVGTVDVPIAMQISDELYVGASLDFYNAVFAKKIDISAISQYLTEIHLEAINSEAFDSSLEELILGTEISEVNVNALTQLTNLGKAKYLKKLGICKFNGLVSIDLSQNNYLEEVDARGCANLTNIVFPDAAPITTLYLPANLQRLALKEITTLQTLSLIDNGANITNIDIRSCNISGFTDAPTKLFAWMNSRGDVQGQLDVYVDNINWNNVNPSDIIEFGEYVKSKGYLTLKGRCILSGLTLEQVDLLRATFGNNCFDADASLRFVASGIFLTGPNDILSGSQYQYSVVNATGAIGSVTFTVTESAGITGLTITNQGLLTVPEITDSNKNITIRATFIDAETGDITNETMNIVVRRCIYPANATIIGPSRVESRHTYTWSTTTSGVNTNDKMYAIWSLSGNISNYVRIASQNLESCILELFDNPILETGTLTLTLKKLYNDSTILSTTFTVSAFDNTIAFTSQTDPYLMEVMHAAVNANGDPLAASADYMTKLECNAVVNADLYSHATPNVSNSIFYNNGNPGHSGPHGSNYFKNNCTNLDNFKWFTGLTQIPAYCFSYCIIESIILPENITSIKTCGLSYDSTTGKLKNIEYYGNNTISLEAQALFLDLTSNDIFINFNLNNNITDTSGIYFNTSNTKHELKLKYLSGYLNFYNKNSKICDIKVLDYSDTLAGNPYGITAANIYLYKEFVNQSRLKTTANFYLYNITNIPNFALNDSSSYLANVYCNDEIINLGRGLYTEFKKLYLLNNNVVPQTCNLQNSDLTGKCIVVRHDMLSAFQAAFPSIEDHFTDGFIPEGNPIDVQVTGDDVIGQAVGTLLHISKQYNGHYADGTSGTEWITEDIEQEDNFFPQNETNAPIQRTINVTVDGFQRSCTITQYVKRIYDYVEVTLDKNYSGFIINANNNKYQDYVYIDEVYKNNVKIYTGHTINPYFVNGNQNDKYLICLSIDSGNSWFGLNNCFSSQIISNFDDVLKEVYFSKFSYAVGLEKAFYGDYSLLKITLPNTNSLSIKRAFQYDSRLKEVVCTSNIQPVDVSSAFTSVSATGILKYPLDSDYSNMIAVLPSGWTTQYIYPPYLIFKSVNSFTLAASSSVKCWNGTLEYSTDKQNWTIWDGTTTLNAINNDGTYYLYLRGKNTQVSYQNNRHFVLTGSSVECLGDIRTLLDYEDVENATMANYCFSNLFDGCTALIKAPELFAETLSNYCYYQMFWGCRNLIEAPKLPSTTLAQSCYAFMFYGCSFTTPPELPATVLQEGCYANMFSHCLNLTKAPIIRAVTLATNCYLQMFDECSSLSEVILLYDAAFDTTKATDWLNNVAAQGIFTKNPNLSIVTGSSGIPSGWTIEDLDPPYLEFSSPNTFSINIEGGKKWDGTLEYSTDLLTWNIWTGDVINAVNDGTVYKIYLRGKNTKIGNSSYAGYFKIIGNDVSCNGEICTLLNYEDYIKVRLSTTYTFGRLFYNCSALIKVPKIGIINTTEGCCQMMFQNCINLIESPILKVKTLTNLCYSGMFNGCTNLNKITILATDISANNCLYNWVSNVAASGNFYRDANTTFPSGNSGIPNGWTDHPMS